MQQESSMVPAGSMTFLESAFAMQDEERLLEHLYNIFPVEQKETQSSACDMCGIRI